LNIVVALAEPQNYAFQFKNVTSLKKLGFDETETTVITKYLDEYVETLGDQDVSPLFNFEISSLKFGRTVTSCDIIGFQNRFRG
jgi:hypothetical protein